MFNLQSMSLYELENLLRIVSKAEDQYDELDMPDRAEELADLWGGIVLEMMSRKEEEA